MLEHSCPILNTVSVEIHITRCRWFSWINQPSKLFWFCISMAAEPGSRLSRWRRVSTLARAPSLKRASTISKESEACQNRFSALFLAFFDQKILYFGILGNLVTLRELQITGTKVVKNKVEAVEFITLRTLILGRTFYFKILNISC